LVGFKHGRSILLKGILRLGVMLLAFVFPCSATAKLKTGIIADTMYSRWIVMELQRPVPQPCGCGGVAAVTRLADIRHGLQWALARNIGLETLAVCILLFVPVRRSFPEAKTGQK